VKRKVNKSTEEVKELLKAEIDPVNMEIGIRTFKSRKNGNFLIEADSKEEIEVLNCQIRNKCSDELETNNEKE
jgi:hypothetical protein